MHGIVSVCGCDSVFVDVCVRAYACMYVCVCGVAGGCVRVQRILLTSF